MTVPLPYSRVNEAINYLTDSSDHILNSILFNRTGDYPPTCGFGDMYFSIPASVNATSSIENKREVYHNPESGGETGAFSFYFLTPLDASSFYERTLVVKASSPDGTKWMKVTYIVNTDGYGQGGGVAEIYLEDSSGGYVEWYSEELYRILSNEIGLIQFYWYAGGTMQCRYEDYSYFRSKTLNAPDNLFAAGDEIVITAEYSGNNYNPGAHELRALTLYPNYIVGGPVWTSFYCSFQDPTMDTEGSSTYPDNYTGPGIKVFPQTGQGEDWFDWETWFVGEAYTVGTTWFDIGWGRWGQLTLDGNDLFSLAQFSWEFFGDWGFSTYYSTPSYIEGREGFIRFASEDGTRWIDVGRMFFPDLETHQLGWRTHLTAPVTGTGSTSNQFYRFFIEDGYLKFYYGSSGPTTAVFDDIPVFDIFSPDEAVTITHQFGINTSFRFENLDTCEIQSWNIAYSGLDMMRLAFTFDCVMEAKHITHYMYARTKIDSNLEYDPEALTHINPGRPSDSNIPFVVGDRVVVLDRYHREFLFEILSGASGVTEDIPNIVFFKHFPDEDLYASLVSYFPKDDQSVIVEQHIISSLIDTTPVSFDLNYFPATEAFCVQIFHNNMLITDQVRVFHLTTSSKTVRVTTDSTTALLNVKVNIFYERLDL